MKAFQRAVASMAMLAVLSGGARSAFAGTVTVPAGTVLSIRMTDGLDSRTSNSGETFRGTIDAPVILNNRVVIPSGAEAIGRVSDLQRAGRFRGRASVVMELTALNFDGKSVGVFTSRQEQSAVSSGSRTALFTAGGAVAGALLGGFAGGKKGFAMGGLLGAAGGALVHFLRGPAPVIIPPESRILFTLQSPM